ncbi:MAG: DUF2062 domain-containing protein [Rhodospirillaceae bacterium]|jgi:hypothetical protein|nr:DUF2062 domain-containing protein [Rhodospirillaceae bacterium]MBT5374149.1 DUF2062 domain-containing protein [Rhodospirillaceae bacterium]MBT5660303.1 DUF2062 domain-containing protein [Rhodospirillaceae bacterium]
MFLRRRKLHLHHKVREYVWPRSGWRRASRYLGHRIMRLSGSPYSIAAGFACGAAISFTPFIGFHFIIAALLAWVINAHILASALGTAVGNPWTFPFIWVWIYKLGQLMLGGEAHDGLPDELTMNIIFDHPLEVFLPMFLGSLPTAVLVWIAFYFPLKKAIAGYQHHRQAKLLKRRKED